jgi:hypothetical protein
LIKGEKKFLPYKISPFFFLGLNDPTPTGAPATNFVLGFRVDELFSWGNLKKAWRKWIKYTCQIENLYHQRGI